MRMAISDIFKPMNLKSIAAIMLLVLLAACASAPKKPAWVSGKAKAFPDAQYFATVGKAPLSGKPADAQSQADQAAISQIKSLLQAQIKSNLASETNSALAGLGPDRIEKYGQLIKEEVNASLELEKIGIADRFCDQKNGSCYALAMLDRKKDGEMLLAKLNDLDLELADLNAREHESLIARDPLAALGYLVRAEKILAQEIGVRAQYSAISAAAFPAKYSFADLIREQERVKSSVTIMVFAYTDAPGKKSGNLIEQYLIEGLDPLGFSAFPAPAELKNKGASQIKALLLSGKLNPTPAPVYVLLASFSTKKIGESRQGGVVFQVYRTGGELYLFDVNIRSSLISMFDAAPEATKAQDLRADRAAAQSLNQAGEYFSELWLEILNQRFLKPESK